MSRIPSTWTTARFGDLNGFTSKTINPAAFPQERFELYSIPVFPSGRPELPLGSDIGSTKQLVSTNDVLISKINPRINRVWQVGPSIGLRQIASSEWIGFRCDSIVSRYFHYYFTSPDFRESLCADVTGVGGSLTRAQPARVALFPIPLAPVGEQRRIADKLDTILARVDAVNDRLGRVAPLLKRFRQSVLAAATSGRLTADWRAGRSPDWAQSLFAEVVVDSSTGLVRSASEQFSIQDGLVPYLKMNCIGEMWGYECVDLPGVHCSAEEFQRYELQKGDWLFNTRNSAELVGKSCVWNGPAGVVFNNNLLRARFQPGINPMWVEIYFRSPKGRDLLTSVKSATTSVAAIYQRSLMGLPMLRPPEIEQTEIVRRVETLFAFADRLEARLKAAQTASERLTPSLLAKAFRGELVPQDPNDEPASELLQRLASQTEGSSRAGGRAKRAKTA
jgi:type I restriction enzyme S subunit